MESSSATEIKTGKGQPASDSDAIIQEALDSGQMGVAFNLQRYTVHDGPGTRTQVFLKGCPLRCQWCANPESWSIQQEIGVFSQRCIGVDKCALCLEACPIVQQAVFTIEDNLVTAIDRSLCTGCLACADACPANALTVWGNHITVSDQLNEVCKDRAFFDQTGGGITLSGGEPFVQWRFTLALLKASKRRGLHTCVESALPVAWDKIEPALPFIDFFITDIKHMDPNQHRIYTGVSNEIILDNIRRVTATGKPVVIRVPVIPGLNDSDENMREVCRFIAEDCGGRIQQLQLLSYHELGKIKYTSLGIDYALEGFEKPSGKECQKRIYALAELAGTYGLPAVVGANTIVSR